MIICAVDIDIRGGSLSVFHHAERTTVFYNNYDDRMRSDSYRTFWHETDVPAANEICPVVAARIVWDLSESDDTYDVQAIAEVGALLGDYLPSRGPFARAAHLFLAWEMRYIDIVQEREHVEFLATYTHRPAA